MRFPGFQEYEQSLLLLDHGRNPFRGDANRVIPNPKLEPGRIAMHDAVGQFAIVYKIRSNGKLWALRCPKAGFPGNVRERCRRVSETLPKSSPRYLLETVFAEPGMFVGGREVPVMLMEWVDGENLRDRVESLCRTKDQQGLQDLAYRFRALCAAMDKDQFSHGDLSHGNILVRHDGSIVLVDYDTVYRVGDSGGRRTITGTPGYAHPNPSESLMQEGPDMDVLPRLIIRLALDCYAAQPQLFGRYSNETLMLDNDDLLQPLHSARLSEVRQVVPSVASTINEITSALARWDGATRQPWSASPTRMVQPPPVPSEPVPITYQPGDAVQPSKLQPPPKTPYAPGNSNIGSTSLIGPQKPAYNPGDSLK